MTSLLREMIAAVSYEFIKDYTKRSGQATPAQLNVPWGLLPPLQQRFGYGLADWLIKNVPEVARAEAAELALTACQAERDALRKERERLCEQAANDLVALTACQARLGKAETLLDGFVNDDPALVIAAARAFLFPTQKAKP